ncbi:hypothetical protein N7456_001729 [Penicillium angulare]|uniref:DUF7702 domain-containing protein n=1 Tax=Penicillium angulare TaxID=116970 RepID=A0A9W9G7U5_9EURO|nr:hypothetical protein N7456_001729 [Penicillium angulare]
MQPHETLACVELALYVALLLPTTFCTIHYLLRGQTAWLYLHAFVIAKIAGPALLIYISEHSSPSTDMQMAAQILYQIALGPLMSSTLSFVNASSKTDKYNSGPSYSPLNALGSKKGSSFFLLLIHPIIMVGLVLGIIGGIDRSPSSDGTINTDKYDRGATFSKASAALFMVALLAITLGCLFLWKTRKGLAISSRYIFTCLPVVLPMLLLRILYSVLNAANLDTSTSSGHTTKYNIMNGSWGIYFVMGFIPQACITIVYIGSGVLAWKRSRGGRQ